ncbi:hypothetical protein [Cupriavidus sp. RAF12]|uniref:hypothetical protein n=1 Tax=Cupriavidus sp. RAF12 TaxID=3233050 RepID=UPI003F8F2162
MNLPVTMTPIDFMSILKKLDDAGTPWDFRGSSEGTLHLYADGEMTEHRIKLADYGSWTAHSTLVVAL